MRVVEKTCIIHVSFESVIHQFALEVLEECPWQLPNFVQCSLWPEDFARLSESLRHIHHKDILSLIY
jgi:hypothetical protein